MRGLVGSTGLVLCLCLCLATVGWAGTKYAVLVGVDGYPSLDAAYQLHGPANDVTTMRAVLRNRGFTDDHIQLIADLIPGAAVPTRAAILQALADITQKTQRGDFVYLHFSGHGSQQPEDPRRTDRGHKSDGMNEVFLPRDVGKWSDTDNSITNAIIDFEMNASITALRNKGVFVWAVFDSCHSASMARGVAVGDVRFRRVDPASLGVPKQRLENAARGAAASRSTPSGQADSPLGPLPMLSADAAGFVAFYAAQMSETTPEMLLPRDADDRKIEGVFSYILARGIDTGANMTYRQLRDYVLEQYAALGNIPVTPLVEGTDLDAAIFGGAPAKRVKQWKIEREESRFKISAGAIHGIPEGALFAVVPSPLAKDKEATSYLKARGVKIFQCDLVVAAPPAWAGNANSGHREIGKGAYARLIESIPDFSLRVAMPPNLNHESGDETRARQLLMKLKTAHLSSVRVNWVAAGEPADLRLSFRRDEIGKSDGSGGRLWFLSPSGQFESSAEGDAHSIDVALPNAELNGKVEEVISRVSRFVNLMRVAAEMPIDGEDQAGVQIRPQLTRRGHRNPTPWENGTLPQLFSGDIVEFSIRNSGSQAADITLLFLDSQYGITAMYPAAGRLNRVEPDGDDSVKIQINADTLGVERMLTIVVDAKPGQPNADFSFLAQNSLQQRDRGARSGLEALFEQAVFVGSSARGLSRSVDPESAHIRMISWRTVPAEKSGETAPTGWYRDQNRCRLQ